MKPTFNSTRAITAVCFLGACAILHGVFLHCATLQAEDRTPWTSSRVVGSPEPAKPFHIKRTYPNLQFRNPVELRVMPGNGHMLMLQVDGKLFAFEDTDECEEAKQILDLGEGAERLRAFGFGLHPRFEENRELYVVYSHDVRNVPNAARLSRFRIPRQPPFDIDRASEEILLTWMSGGHNGSTVEFDSEGLLYFSAGDGARPFPPDEFDVGQNLSDLRATICRIDVDHPDGERPYRIPDDNPFVDHAGARGEIWAYGFRNPWRFTIDQSSGRLLCGDVGWEMWESVFDVKRGGNYGWSIFEGPGALRDDVQQGPTPIEKPLAAYSHSLGQSITGGIVYRGSDLPELEGVYLYGDYVSGLLWGLRQNGDEVSWNPVLAETGIPIITFSRSARGEALVVSYNGEIYQLQRNPLVDRPVQFPRRLSETGMFETVADLAPAPGVYSYGLQAEAHHPGVTKTFHVGVPHAETIKVARQKRQWKFPVGTVFARTLSKRQAEPSVSTKRIETQLLHFDGLSWKPYSYLWNASQDDAELVAAEPNEFPLDELGFAGESWSIHPRSQCRSCHTNQTGGAVGFSLENLSNSSIRRFVDLGIINQEAPQGWNLRKMVNPLDEEAELADRARSYLAANCAHCHRRGGGGSVALDLEVSNPIEAINAVDAIPMQGAFDIADAKVIHPGRPLHSVLLYRLATSGVGRMPKLSHHDPDPDGILLVHDWIRSMAQPSEAPRETETSEALGKLVSMLRAGDPGAAIAEARSARSDGKIMIEGLFEQFLPDAERRKQLGPNIDTKQILAMNGDASSGRNWLTETRGAQCLACHRLDGRGHNIGPAFDKIGSKRTREHLLQSIIKPSAEVEPKYRSRTVLTEDGKSVTGLIIRENDQSLTLRSSDGRNHTIDLNTIEFQKQQTESLMPSGQAETMTARELADLIAYLQSLK